MKKLKMFNGRSHCVLPDQDRWKDSHINIAAYSIADARRLCVELGLLDPGYNEIKNYFSECWGNDMNGIAPERGIWVSSRRKRDTKATRVTKKS